MIILVIVQALALYKLLLCANFSAFLYLIASSVLWSRYDLFVSVLPRRNWCSVSFSNTAWNCQSQGSNLAASRPVLSSNQLHCICDVIGHLECNSSKLRCALGINIC